MWSNLEIKVGRELYARNNVHNLTFKLPFDPLSCGKFVLVQVIFVGKITVAVNVAGVATKDEHAPLVHDG